MYNTWQMLLVLTGSLGYIMHTYAYNEVFRRSELAWAIGINNVVLLEQFFH